ncbi:MAG: prevent-host-death protein [Deltaproteobacteria bacterium RIFCSPHIGHO2_12_FULL_43_9]|nr:MAG: prevent-host-death protein [Deltaproteobacteria bacterium RIFCSPHIGHO2_12_FULL_43_9]
MKKIGSYQAKTNLPKLLEKVSKGEEFTITKHGVPVAQLIPISRAKRRDMQSSIEKVLKFRGDRSLGGLNVRDLIKEGRKY